MTTLITIVVIIAILFEILATILMGELVVYFKHKNEKSFRDNNNIQSKINYKEQVGNIEQTKKKNNEPTNKRNNRE